MGRRYQEVVSIPVQRDACRLGPAQDPEEVGWQGGRHGLFLPWTDSQKCFGKPHPKAGPQCPHGHKSQTRVTIAEAGVVPQSVLGLPQSIAAAAGLMGLTTD
jgi:hypothetical protein